MLGVMLSEAQVVERDDKRALPLLRRGCDAAEDGESCFWLAKALREGRGVARDAKAAAIAKARACKLEFSAACR
jgi:TPR repeat protein